MLNIENYYVAYGQSLIIDKLNMTVGNNEIVSLLGRNGMGKTTLMKSLIGMIPSKQGRVQLDQQELEGRKSYQRVMLGLGFVPQGRMVFPSMTVEDNIRTGLANGKNKEIPDEIYQYFPVLLDMKKRLAGNLSGGQQQQLAIARALASKPKLLLLDEPTEGIQPSIIKEIAQILRKIRDEQGLTILVSEQVLSFAQDVADRILIMEKGNIIFSQDRQHFDTKQIASYLAV